MSVQNLAVKLCGVLQSQSDIEINAREWRLIGQERDGSQLLSWLSVNTNGEEVMNIGLYTNKTKSLKELHTFNNKLNIIQASVNLSQNLLVYVVKTLPNGDEGVHEAKYTPYILPLLSGKENKVEQIEESSNKQVMVQFLYGKSYKYTPGTIDDRFLLFTHLEC